MVSSSHNTIVLGVARASATCAASATFFPRPLGITPGEHIAGPLPAVAQGGGATRRSVVVLTGTAEHIGEVVLRAAAPSTRWSGTHAPRAGDRAGPRAGPAAAASSTAMAARARGVGQGARIVGRRATGPPTRTRSRPPRPTRARSAGPVGPRPPATARATAPSGAARRVVPQRLRRRVARSVPDSSNMPPSGGSWGGQGPHIACATPETSGHLLRADLR